MAKLSLKAYAKINLGLDVLRQREDGYHELRMVMQTTGLYDTVTLEQTETPGIVLSTDRADLPTDRTNLAYRAAELLFLRFSLPGGIRIGLEKRIPAAAGLAGGSADAAAVLRGMRELYRIPVSPEELSAMSLPLGADVPYCVLCGTAVAEGIGERLTFLAPLEGFRIVIVKPAFDLSTPYIYKNLHVAEIPPEAHPDMETIIGALAEGRIFDAAPVLGNLLEVPALRAFPEIRDIRQRFLSCGAVGASMTGSGSAVFGIFRDTETAEQCAEAFRADGKEAFTDVVVTGPVGRLL